MGCCGGANFLGGLSRTLPACSGLLADWRGADRLHQVSEVNILIHPSSFHNKRAEGLGHCFAVCPVSPLVYLLDSVEWKGHALCQIR